MKVVVIVVNFIAIDNDTTRTMFEAICIVELVNVAAVVALLICEQWLVFIVGSSAAAGRVDNGSCIECFWSFVRCDMGIRMLEAWLLPVVVLDVS